MSLLQANLAGLGGTGAPGGALAGGAVYDHTIGQSLRFPNADSGTGDAYLSRTPSSAGDRRTWTYSVWVKRSKLGSGSSNQSQLIWAAFDGGDADQFRFGDTNDLEFYLNDGTNANIQTNQLFRDVSAWYHIVLAVDTTQSIASNRVKFYVNGEQITSFSTATYPSENYDTDWNSNVVHAIGQSARINGTQFFCGYLGEINFIDGAQYDASYFGETKDGVWIPKEYSGSYGTNGFYLPFSDSTYIGRDKSGSKTFVTSPSFSTFGGGDTNFTSAEYAEAFDNILSTDCDRTGSGGIIDITPSSSVTPVSHTMINASSSAYTAASRPNSVLLQGSNDGGSNWTTIDDLTNGSGSHTATTSSFSNTTSYAKLRLNISENHGGSNTRFAQYIVIASDNNGDGENIFFNTNLAASDVVIDSPTNSFPILIPGYYQTTQEGGLKLKRSSSGNIHTGCFSTMGVSSGKWYVEIKYEDSAIDTVAFGVAETKGGFDPTVDGTAYVETSGISSATHMEFAAWSVEAKLSSSYAGTLGSAGSYGSSPSSGDIIQIALDMDNKKIWYGVNGTYIASGDPANGTNASQSGSSFAPTGEVVFVASAYMGRDFSISFNFGQDSANVSSANADENGIGTFEYAPPSGFLALCTSNLPDITIGPGQDTQADDHFETMLYAGNGAEQHIGSGGAQHPQDTISITNSLRFEAGSSAYLSRTQGSSPTDISKWTVNFWLKRTNVLSASDDYDTVFGVDGPGNTAFTFLNGQIYLFVNYNAGGSQARLITNRKFLNPATFYNFHITFDRTASTASERLRLYVNGVEETSFSTDERSSIASNSSSGWNVGGESAAINRRSGGQDTRYHNGYISQFYNIDGAVVAPTEFAQVGANGYWIPKTYSGSYGNNGWLLEFKQTGTGSGATNTVGADTSGNTNHWDSSGITSEDRMIDSPTQNFATLSPVDSYSSAHTFSEGNLRCTHNSGTWRNARSTFRVTSGKWYWETVFESVSGAGGFMYGIGNELLTTDANPNTNYSVNYNGISSGTIIQDGTTVNTGTAYTAGDVMGLALDIDAGTVKFYKNNTLVYTVTSITGTEFYPILSASATGATHSVINLGQDDSFAGNKTPSNGAQAADGNSYGSFYYTPPTGYLALVDDNIPKEGIASPDWVWIKERSSTSGHALHDSVRGAGKYLGSHSTSAEGTSTTQVTSFDANGFTTGPSGQTNESSQTYASWNWKAGGISPTQTYAVTVADDSGQNKYRFDGNTTFAPTLSLQEGGTYTFDQSDSSNSGHPLRFSTTSDGTHGSGSEYTVGVTTSGTPGSSGAKTVIALAYGAPTLYYYCNVHSGMGGQVNTTDTHGSTNLKGSIQSVVSASTDAGFSIVTWDALGSSTGTVGHGLTVAPDIIIAKARDHGTNWFVQVPDVLANTHMLNLETTGAAYNPGYNHFNDTVPTDSVFSIGGYLGNHSDIGNSDTDKIAYCFHSVDGYSKVGSYVGNGSTDGTFVFLGFRPSFLLTKESSSTSGWNLRDSVRSPDNPVNEVLQADTTSSEMTSNYNVDFFSNGFKLRTSLSDSNTSGQTYIYLAFAEQPFKFANAR